MENEEWEGFAEGENGGNRRVDALCRGLGHISQYICARTRLESEAAFGDSRSLCGVDLRARYGSREQGGDSAF